MSDERCTLVSGNWKMHKDHLEALKLVRDLAALFRVTRAPEGREVSVHPPFTSLRTVQIALESEHIPLALGAQNCHYEDEGAFTGEVSATMLAKMNVAYVIAGHSERRARYGETDALVRSKVDAILAHQMTPILCVGESLEERQAEHAFEFVKQQVTAVLSNRSAESVANVVVAYEPLWAIEAGQTASTKDVETMCRAIREEVERFSGARAAASIRLQYGGSVTPETAGALLAAENVDGLLVGAESLDAAQFFGIVSARD
jgi:triosephosphate isomerase